MAGPGTESTRKKKGAKVRMDCVDLDMVLQYSHGFCSFCMLFFSLCPWLVHDVLASNRVLFSYGSCMV